MDLYKKNLENIKKYKKQIYEKVLEYNGSFVKDEIEEIYSVDTKDEIQSLIIKKDNTEYKLNSTFHPIKEAERWVKQYTFYHLNNVIAMFGLGNGLFAEQIMRNMNENDWLIIYEPSLKAFIHVLHHFSLEALVINNRVIITIQDINEHEIHTYLQMHINIRNIKTRITCIHPGYDKVFPERAIYFWSELKNNYFYTMMNINTECVMGKLFIKNTLENFHYLKECNTIKDLGEILPKDIPVVIVAAGPSLENEIEELRKAKGKAVIIAVDRALDYLLNNAIEPDIVATLDPTKPMEQFTEKHEINIPLLYVIESNIEILKKHKGKKIVCNVGNFLSKLYTDNGLMPPVIRTGASVATMAFSSAVEMGFRNIILVGQDLAYKGKITHVGHVAEECSLDMLVEGMDGNKILSRFDWHKYIIWYQDLIKLKPNVNVYDVKTSGAKIKGAILKSFSEIMMDYADKQIDVRTLINNMKPTFNEEQWLGALKYIEDCKNDLKKLKKEAHEGYEICGKLFREWERNGCTSAISKSFVKEINRISKFIEKCNIYKLMESYITALATEELSDICAFSDKEEENRINTYNKSKRIFECIEESCDYAIIVFEEL